MQENEFFATRAALHALAEHVLAPARYRQDQHVGLHPTDAGLETPPAGRQQRVVGVRGDVIYVREGAEEREAKITTLGAAARFVGVEVGVPAGLWKPITAPDPLAPLKIDAPSVIRLARWFQLVEAALAELGDSLGDPLEPVQLWPEHLDLATSGDQVNYGGSPGDDLIAMPYLYVGPWDHPVSADKFWNAPFGAALPITEVSSVERASDFFRTGRGLVVAARGIGA
ncbi:MAG: hypothetical protein JWL70_2546 [Acidimicrobiia bacterium]|nr:hypothetical protein [Acidimicrobiia bacterium]